MDKSNVLQLVSVTYKPDAMGQQIPVETIRDVFCNVQSASAAEWFEAGRNGLTAAFKCTVFTYDYEGEETAILNGERYGIYRTYLKPDEDIELHLGRKVGA